MEDWERERYHQLFQEEIHERDIINLNKVVVQFLIYELVPSHTPKIQKNKKK